MLNSYRWPGATILDSADMKYVPHCTKFYWAVKWENLQQIDLTETFPLEDIRIPCPQINGLAQAVTPKGTDPIKGQKHIRMERELYISLRYWNLAFIANFMFSIISFVMIIKQINVKQPMKLLSLNRHREGMRWSDHTGWGKFVSMINLVI